jgi:hypothetical protein
LKTFKAIYLSGEGYNAKFVPWLANYADDNGIKIHGISIGGALINQTIQN